MVSHKFNISIIHIHPWKKAFTHPFKAKIDMDRISVLPVGWNWHKMYLRVLPSEIRPYFGWTFTSLPSGIAEVQNHSLGGHFPNLPSHCGKFESTITFFSQFLLVVLIMHVAHQGMWQRAIAGHMGLVHAAINHILRRHAATGTLVPAKSMGAPRKTTLRQDRSLLRIVWQDRYICTQASTVPMGNL